LADQTGVWILDVEWLPESPPEAQPHYDFEAVFHRLVQIESEEAQWSDYFGRQRQPPLTVWYEDLDCRYEDTVRTCLSLVGKAGRRGAIPTPGIRRQATGLNAQ